MDYVLILSGPNLPDDFRGNPAKFMQFIRDNFTARISLDLPEAPNSVIEVPVGGMLMWPAGTAVLPDKFLECKGQAISRTDYATLFAKLGTLYNVSGTSVDDFCLPDMRGRVPIGVGVGYVDPLVINKGQLKEVNIGTYTGFSFGTNETPWFGAATYTGAGATYFLGPKVHPTGIKPVGSRGIGSVMQPSVGIKFLIRAI